MMETEIENHPDNEPYERTSNFNARNGYKKKFATDLKTIYQSPLEAVAHGRMLEVTEKWDTYYPNVMKSWSVSWDVISPIFMLSSDVRKAI